jgi:hypothetical protein
MLFKILNLFGLDIPAKIEAVKANFELRVAQATDHVMQVARETAVIAAFFAIAVVTAAMTFVVGLIAVYRWAADAYDANAGLGVVGAILVVVTVLSATTAAIKGRSLAANRTTLPRYPGDVTSNPSVITSTFVADAGTTGMQTGAWIPPTAAAMPATASASDLIEPVAFFVSKFVKFPSIGHPLVDELIGHLRTTAHGTADEAIACAANVVRRGNRTNLVVVLAGAAVAGWALAHHSRQQSLNS